MRRSARSAARRLRLPRSPDTCRARGVQRESATTPSRAVIQSRRASRCDIAVPPAANHLNRPESRQFSRPEVSPPIHAQPEASMDKGGARTRRERAQRAQAKPSTRARPEHAWGWASRYGERGA
jgi:hypothetical protein